MNQEKIGKFIKTLRTEKKMTQQELANKIGVTDRAISKWENGRGTPDISLLIPLSNELNITLLELLNGEKTENKDNVVINLIKNKDKKIKIWKYLFTILINIIMSFMIVIFIFGFVIPTRYNNSDIKGMTKIVSPSMEPTIKIGSSIVYNKININKIKKDDIIVFNYINENEIVTNSYIVHRVIDIQKIDNEIRLITKGDNNLENDKNYITDKNFIGIYSHNLSSLTNYFLKYDIEVLRKILLILTIGILSILCFDGILIKRHMLRY